MQLAVIDQDVTDCRASDMDSLHECAPSVTSEGATRIRSVGEPAKLGKIVHALAASYIESGRFDVSNECNRHGWDDEDEVAKLVYYAVQAWDDLRKFFGKKPLVERAVKGPILDTQTGRYRVVGTIDVCNQHADNPNKVTFADWKSGRVDSGYSNQMFAYAYLLWNFLGRPNDFEATGVVVFLRHRYYRVAKYDAPALKAWEHNLTYNVLSRVTDYHPGDQCIECPIYHTCKAQHDMTRGVMSALLAPRNDDASSADPHNVNISIGLDILEKITPDNKAEPEVANLIGSLVAKRKLGEKLLDELSKAIRRTVERVGTLPTGGGYALALRPTETETIDPQKGWQVLNRHLSAAEILSGCRISYPKMRAAVASKYGRGEKKKAREALEKDLREAGAVSVAVKPRLEEVDLTQELSDGRENSATGAQQVDPRYRALPAPSDSESEVDGGGSGAA